MWITNSQVSIEVGVPIKAPESSLPDCYFPVLCFKDGLFSFDLALTPAPTYFSLLKLSL